MQGNRDGAGKHLDEGPNVAAIGGEPFDGFDHIPNLRSRYDHSSSGRMTIHVTSATASWVQSDITPPFVTSTSNR